MKAVPMNSETPKAITCTVDAVSQSLPQRAKWKTAEIDFCTRTEVENTCTVDAVTLAQGASILSVSRATFWRFRKRCRIATLPGHKVAIADIESGLRVLRSSADGSANGTCLQRTGGCGRAFS